MKKGIIIFGIILLLLFSSGCISNTEESIKMIDIRLMVVIFVILGILILLFGELERREKEKNSDNIEIYSNTFSDLWADYYNEKIDRKLGYKALPLVETLTSTTAIFATKEDVKAEFDKKFKDFKNRVEEIENKFPEDSNVDKYSSITDVLLAKNIEALSQSIKGIESSMLSHWDVAKIFFEILASILVILSLLKIVIG